MVKLLCCTTVETEVKIHENKLKLLKIKKIQSSQYETITSVHLST